MHSSSTHHAPPAALHSWAGPGTQKVLTARHQATIAQVPHAYAYPVPHRTTLLGAVNTDSLAASCQL
jgi:hypothetical protein